VLSMGLRLPALINYIRLPVTHLNEIFTALNEGINLSKDTALIKHPASR